MGYTTPPPFIAGLSLPAASLTILGNDIVDLDSRTKPSGDTLATSETTTSTGYTDLATVNRPTVTLLTGTVVIVVLTASITGSTVGAGYFMGFAVSGASAIAAADVRALSMQAASGAAQQASALYILTVTAGINIFTGKYRVTAGTGTFLNRGLTVWPANQLA
jgi:hypothetical protein